MALVNEQLLQTKVAVLGHELLEHVGIVEQLLRHLELGQRASDTVHEIPRQTIVVGIVLLAQRNLSDAREVLHEQRTVAFEEAGQ